MLTSQMIFDKVAAHLLSLGRPAKGFYFSEDGKCECGLSVLFEDTELKSLIKDNTDLNNEYICEVVSTHEAVEAHLGYNSNGALLRALQELSDQGGEDGGYSKGLHQLAEAFYLNKRVLYESRTTV